jgi:hypothetical protein
MARRSRAGVGSAQRSILFALAPTTAANGLVVDSVLTWHHATVAASSIASNARAVMLLAATLIPKPVCILAGFTAVVAPTIGRHAKTVVTRSARDASLNVPPFASLFPFEFGHPIRFLSCAVGNHAYCPNEAKCRRCPCCANDPGFDCANCNGHTCRGNAVDCEFNTPSCISDTGLPYVQVATARGFFAGLARRGEAGLGPAVRVADAPVHGARSSTTRIVATLGDGSMTVSKHLSPRWACAWYGQECWTRAQTFGPFSVDLTRAS